MGWSEVFRDVIGVEGSTFAGVANLFLVAFLSFTVRPRRRDGFSIKNALAFVMIGVIALLVCMAALSVIGLL